MSGSNSELNTSMLTSILKTSKSSPMITKPAQTKRISFKRTKLVRIYTKPSIECNADMYGRRSRNSGLEIRARQHEVNEFKLRQMQVHPLSRHNNTYHHLPLESFAARARRIEAIYGDSLTESEREEMENEISAYSEYALSYQEIYQQPKPERITATMYNFFEDVPFEMEACTSAIEAPTEDEDVIVSLNERMMVASFDDEGVIDVLEML